MKAAEKMANIAAGAITSLPEGMSGLYDHLTNAVHEAARKGLKGVCLGVVLPASLIDYLPHIIGELRSGGGFCVDILSSDKQRDKEDINIMITW